MGSQRNPGRAETWMGATRVALALSAYLLLNALALRPRVLVTDPSQLGPALPGLVLGWLAESLQFVLPLVLLFGGPVVRRARSFLEPTAPVPICAGQGMTEFEFERLTGGGLRFPRRARAVGGAAAVRKACDTDRPHHPGRVAA